MIAPPSIRSAQPTPLSWPRLCVVAVLMVVGTCEALATNGAIGWDRAPGWLAGAIVMIGYLAYLVLFGFTSLLGNLVAAVMIVVLIRRRWGRPVWQAAAVATPYLVAFYQGFPKPW